MPECKKEKNMSECKKEKRFMLPFAYILHILLLPSILLLLLLLRSIP